MSMKLSSDYKLDAANEKRRGNEKGMIGLGIGGGAGLMVGLIGGILIYSVVKK